MQQEQVHASSAEQGQRGSIMRLKKLFDINRKNDNIFSNTNGFNVVRLYGQLRLTIKQRGN